MDYIKTISNSNIIYSGNNTVKSATKQGEQVVSVISDKTKDFMKKIYNSTTEIILKFLREETKPITTRKENFKLYRFGNILMGYSDGPTAYYLEQNLERVEKFGISPKFAGYFQLSRDRFLTVMEAGSEELLPYSSVAEKISAKTKQDFKNTFIEMVKKGLVNKDALANKDSLLVSNDGKQIIIADWNEVIPIVAEDQKTYIKAINDWQI